jgi:hypothetical protein
LTARQRASLRFRIIRVVIYLILTFGSGFAAFVLFQASAPQQQPNGNDVTPDMLLLTSEHAVSVDITIEYYQWYQSTPEGLGFGPQPNSLPTGAREIQLQFSGGKPFSLLQYSVLLGRDGAEDHPIGQQNEQVFSGNPGGTSSSDCVSPQTAGVVQVLYGKVRLNAQGQANITTVGKLINQHAYLKDGANDVVGVIAVNSPITDLAAVGPGNTCIFPDWPYLGGVLWYSPASLGGKVSIGPVGGNFNVTSSNPPLTNLSVLSWQINDSTSINYTLTDNSIAREQLIESFGAGVAAALAAALAVETVKNAVGKAAEPDDGESAPRKDERRGLHNVQDVDRHPVVTAAIVVATTFAAVRARRSR